jgi:structural maintenance of chromosome 4
MNFLRENKIGRASFIIMNQILDWSEKMKKTISTPDNIPRLFDLIKPINEKVLPALYFAMRDTLVASNLDKAVKIAYVNDKAMWRVVTLDGLFLKFFLFIYFLL